MEEDAKFPSWHHVSGQIDRVDRTVNTAETQGPIVPTWPWSDDRCTTTLEQLTSPPLHRGGRFGEPTFTNAPPLPRLQIKQDVLNMIVQYLRSEKLFMAAVVIQDEANMKTAEQQVWFCWLLLTACCCCCCGCGGRKTIPISGPITLRLSCTSSIRSAVAASVFTSFAFCVV